MLSLLTWRSSPELPAWYIYLTNNVKAYTQYILQFTAWTTYTDGHLIGTDSDMTRDYVSTLQQFALLSSSVASDLEVRNR